MTASRPSERRSLADAVPTPAETAPGPRKRTKQGTQFTMILQTSDAVLLDGLATAGRIELDRRVDKSEILRAAIRLLANDDALKARVYQQILEQDG